MPDLTRVKDVLNSAMSEIRRALNTIEEDERAAMQLNEIPPGSASSHVKHVNSPPNTGNGEPSTTSDPGNETVRLSGSATPDPDKPTKKT